MPPAVIASENHLDSEGALVVDCATVISGSVVSDTIVRKHCSLHVRGDLAGSLTIEMGANVVVDGTVEGRIVNRGGRLVVQHKRLTAGVVMDGQSPDEADAILRVNLNAIAFNWETLVKHTEADCAAVLERNAYGCGIDQVAEALTKSGCRKFFVSNLADARRVRAAAPDAVIYVLHGLRAGAAPAFAKLGAQPVINSALELAEWDAFVSAQSWFGGCALNVDTGDNRLGLSMAEAVELSARLNRPNHDITLLMSNLAENDAADDAQSERKIEHQIERQIELFGELRRLYRGVPASLADASAILLRPKIHFDLVRADAALFGINPTPGSPNPMLPVVELRARILHVRDAVPGQNFVDAKPKRRRFALVSIGQADGFPRSWHRKTKLQAVIGGHCCPVIAPSSFDLLAIDVTDLPDPGAARSGEMATLIGSAMTIDEVAKATRASGREVLSALGSRFHRVYYAT
jgi:alanine racemase